MNHNDYLFSFSNSEFRFLRRFDEMYKNCEDPHGQSKAIYRIDYQIVSSVLDRALRALLDADQLVEMVSEAAGLLLAQLISHAGKYSAPCRNI